MDIFKYKN